MEADVAQFEELQSQLSAVEARVANLEARLLGATCQPRLLS